MHTSSTLRICQLFNELLTDQFLGGPVIEPVSARSVIDRVSARPVIEPVSTRPVIDPVSARPGLGPIKMRYPSDFADALMIHVNHLNRRLKEVTGKTTSELIAEKLEVESCTLLRHSHYTCSEIAFALGFAELPHFINFFKRRVGVTPNSFRKEEMASLCMAQA